MLALERMKPVELLTDATVAEHFAKSLEGVKRSRAIDIRYHNTRGEVQAGTVVVSRVPSTEQRADVLTKPADVEQFRRQVSSMMSRVIG